MLLVRVLLLVLCCASILRGGPAAALDPERSLGQYKHTRWTVEDGAPGGINSLAQGADGYLWIGSTDGLFRFDGLSFEPILPERPFADRSAIGSLLASRDGSIWVGYMAGGVAKYRNGLLCDAAMPNPTAPVIKLIESPAGVIWAFLGRTKLPLVRYSGGAWQEIGANWGLPPDQPRDLLAARDGTVWLSTNHALFSLMSGSRIFQKVSEVPVGHAALSQDASGNIWLSDDAGSRVVAPVKEQLVYPTPPARRRVATIFDHDGDLWGVTGNAGLFRVRVLPSYTKAHEDVATRVDRFGAKDTLTSDGVVAIIEDREGSIWIGTSLGLDRLRTAAVVSEPLLTGIPTWGLALLGTSGGTVYVGGIDGVYRIEPGGQPEQVVSGAGETEAICEAPDGKVWMIMEQRIVEYYSGRATSFIKPSTKSPVDCAADQQGALWLSDDLKLQRFAGMEWQTLATPENKYDDTRPIIRSRDGSLMMYLGAETLRRIDFPHESDIILPQKPVLKYFRSLYEGMDSILLGGTFGLARWRNGQLDIIDASRSKAFAAITGILQISTGETWLMGGHGIVHISTAALNHAFGDALSPLKPTVLDYRDGLRGLHHRNGKRDIARGGDGRLWFATTAGAVWLDPMHLPYNAMPPPVAISSLKANGLAYRDPANVTLPPGTSTAEIDFAALSLLIPERVSVRYRLLGANQDWIDPGSRRAAFYTNLGPGKYRFETIAANNDGVWNRQGASLQFTILPTFFQSNGFYFLCITAAGGLTWLAYSARTRHLTAQIRGRLEVQLAERERIARELHDTLLQGFQGLVLRFQSIANRIPAGQPIRTLIDQALDRAEEVLVEGRNRVSELRSMRESTDVAQALTAIATDLAADWPARFSLTVEGLPRDLSPAVRIEIIRIGEEAIGNAFRHANATRIDALLIFGRRELQLGIRDDGGGLPEDVVVAGKRAGRFGLVGMRERAERMGGVLYLTSREARGTEIRVVVGGHLAYGPRSSWRTGRPYNAPPAERH